MSTNRRSARIVGALFIVGTVAGVLSVLVTQSLLNSPDYLTQVSENANRLILGSLLVLTMGLALAMVPVVLFPITRKHNEVLALGYVIFRGALEPIAYLGMVVPWLVLVPLSQEYVQAGSPDASYLQALGAVLLTAHDSTNHILIIVFSLGALMLYSLAYQSELIPRWLSIWGFIAILLHFATAFLLMFGLFGDESPLLLLMNFPIFLQEMVMAVWLIVKGFNPSAVASGPA